ncbi:hypothetical protein NQ314_017691 [Rhamnusium bicolor]|uniref:Tyr recombinase domain-containing protein n=1 Tax=Rhamnusium bicolor TaxID=1586634 RepID=A0AAV8WT40_9CUCU|nr:hypothetical protein NQ314_017691 [Rhamnusium bicolor]
MSPKSAERRNAIAILRRKGNFVLQTEQQFIKPVRKPIGPDKENLDNVNYSSYSNNTKNHRSQAQTFLVSTGLLGNLINKSRIREVFKSLRADNIGFAARSDPLICLYGESILGKHKRKQVLTVVSQKMLLKPENYNYIIAATKVIAGFDTQNLSFKSPSLALQLGTDLKFMCQVAKKAITIKDPLMGRIENRGEKRNDISQLHEMIASHWSNDIGSLANKNSKKPYATHLNEWWFLEKGLSLYQFYLQKKLKKYTDMLIEIRRKTNLVPKENKYIFATSGSTRWISGSAVISKLASACGAKQPKLLTSTRFRKQIATILQLMSFENDELYQVAKFMGHTEKTHMEYYRLTESTYQTAKVAKILLLLESGRGAEFKGKALNEITLDNDFLDDEVEDSQQPENEADIITYENPSAGFIRYSRKGIQEDVAKEKKMKLTNIKGRVKWEPHQKNIVLKAFKKHIKNRIPPKKSECLKFLSENPKFSCDWIRIKTLVFNTYRDK